MVYLPMTIEDQEIFICAGWNVIFWFHRLQNS